MAGYAHDICDQLDVVSQAMVDFDLAWLADIERTTIYNAELVFPRNRRMSARQAAAR